MSLWVLEGILYKLSYSVDKKGNTLRKKYPKTIADSKVMANFVGENKGTFFLVTVLSAFNRQ